MSGSPNACPVINYEALGEVVRLNAVHSRDIEFNFFQVNFSVKLSWRAVQNNLGYHCSKNNLPTVLFFYVNMRSENFDTKHENKKYSKTLKILQK